MTKTTHKGFTLIEMLITLAILAVVTSIAIPAYTGYVKTAKMAEAQNNLAALRLAEEEYFLENNSYFFGADYSELETNSAGLWKRTKGKDPTPLFDYAVTNSNGWTATAKGNVAGTSVYNEVITIQK